MSEPAQTPPAATPTTETPSNEPPASAAAAIATPTTTPTATPAETPPAQTPPAATPTTETPKNEPPASAAAAIAKPAEQKAEVKDIDLAKTSDEDYAKLVLPDVDGQEVDRSLITPMAKELRAAGIQPHVMAKVGEIYRKVVKDEIAKDEAARAARMKEMSAKCLEQVTDDEKRDFAAAYFEHIAKDATLKHVVDHTELGSNLAFIKLIALAGATLRVETPPPASATAGSSQTDLDRRIFEKTVPKDLR